MNSLYFATGNSAKFEETERFIGTRLPDLRLGRIDVDIPEIQGPDADLILGQKAEFVARQTSRPFVVDDASFNAERYPGFPGSYANFLDRTVGLEGWRKLFSEGDRITAIARVGLHYLGELQVFTGEVSGAISFKDLGRPESVTLGNLLVVDGLGTTLSNALQDPDAMTHRKKALAQLCDWIQGQHDVARSEQDDISRRWTERSAGWEDLIADGSTYVNYEDNYGRVNKLARQFAPLADSDLLEIGCGTGEAGRIAYDANPALQVVGIDVAEGMIDQANRQRGDRRMEYRVSNLAAEARQGKQYGMLLSRGIVISHIPRIDVYDFLVDATSLTADGGYFLFDFMQDVNRGDENERPVGRKNEFTLGQMDAMMQELGWERVADDGQDDYRVRVVCYKKSRADSPAGR